MTPADLIAGIRELEAEIARLRAQVATLTASTPSPAPGGLAAVAKAAAELHADIERAAALNGNCPICETGLPCHARELDAALHALASTPPRARASLRVGAEVGGGVRWLVTATPVTTRRYGVAPARLPAATR